MQLARRVLLALALIIIGGSIAMAAPGDEVKAKAMAAKAAAFVKDDPAAAIKQFINPEDKEYHDRDCDLYVVAFKRDGILIAGRSLDEDVRTLFGDAGPNLYNAGFDPTDGQFIRVQYRAPKPGTPRERTDLYVTKVTWVTRAKTKQDGEEFEVVLCVGYYPDSPSE